MQSLDLFHELGRVLPEGDSVLVLSALRQDSLVWQSLEDPDFFSAVLECAGSQPALWSPGHLALLALGDSRTPEVLSAGTMPLLGQPLQEKALSMYQYAQRTGTPPASIRDAGLLALALRERRRLTGSWHGLLQEILPKPGQPESFYSIWGTPLAVLYSLVPDPEEMLRNLLPKTALRVPVEWITHTQLCQPVSDQDHLQIFTQLMQGLPVTLQLTQLRSLGLHGRESIAAALADRLLMAHPAFTSLRAPVKSQDLDLAALSNRALALQQMGSFYQISGDRVQALSLFSAAEKALGQWLAGLYLQRLDLQIGEGLAETRDLMSSSQMAHMAEAAGWLKDELGVVLLSHPYAASLIDQVDIDSTSAFLHLKRAYQLADREPAVARDLARQSANTLLEEIRRSGIPFSGEFVYAWHPRDPLQILLELDLPDEALRLARALLGVRPNDSGLLQCISKICERLGMLKQAIRFAQTLVALTPDRSEGRRLLGHLYSVSGDWEKSFAEWEKVLEIASPPTVDDRLTCARAALKVDRVENAVELCEHVLSEDPNHGSAMGLMGQALIARGEHQQAVDYLVRATHLAPEALDPWLCLANLQQEMNEPQRALDTLRAAVTAVPEATEAHLALGQMCLTRGLPAEALPHLKKAFLLSPGSEQAALYYGRTLRELGHASDARAVLERHQANWASCPELAYEYAQIMLDLDDAESALPALETALRGGCPVLDGYLLYAKILMGEYRTSSENWSPELVSARMQQADQALRRILEIDPDNLEASFLMADILRERGQLDEALELYRSLGEMTHASKPELRWRIQWGLGRTALSLDQVDIALASLKEACQLKPGLFALHRSLAEASLRANLPQEALDAAANALQISPDDVDVLIWYADFVAGAGDKHKAVEALERAVQLDPCRADLFVGLAHLQLSSGDLNAARVSLQSLLEMETATRQDLRRAAQIYMRLEDTASALACFELALKIDSDADAPESPAESLHFEVAQLQERLGNLEAALEFSQSVLDDSPESLPVYLFQSGLLARLDRPQAAQALLERALRIAGGDDEESASSLVKSTMLVEIHERFTRLMLQEGNLPAAMYHAEKALSLYPEGASQDYRAMLSYRAADLALALLQIERAAGIVRSIQPADDESPLALLRLGKSGVDLLCLLVEIALHHDQLDQLSEWIEKGLSHSPDHPRLLAAKVRLLVRQKDQTAARQAFDSIRDQNHSLWYAEAALELQQWTLAVEVFEQYVQAYPGEARGHFGLARALVISAEQQRFCQLLGCRSNAPGEQSLSEARRKQFEEAIRAVGLMVNAGETGRWQARGLAVFSPSMQNTRALATTLIMPEDNAALVAALRQVNSPVAAVQVARRSSEHPGVLLQLALCYLDNPGEEGISAAEQAVAADPNQPLAHVALALIAQRSGNTARAIQCYEAALAIWQNEPDWHEAVSDLYMQEGDIKKCTAHRKQAQDLEPDNAGYAYKFGEACLADGAVSEAVYWLEKSTTLDPQNANVWLALAEAYRTADRLSQALEAARQASRLDSTSAEGLLAAGEIALSMGEADQALEFARSAVRREPDKPAVVLFLSNVLVCSDQVKDALDALEGVPPAVKADFPVAFERAKLIHRLHGPQAVMEVLEKLAKDYPEEPGLLNMLAQVQAECGELRSAERYAFKALRLDPNQPELTLMLGRLQRRDGQLDQAVHLLSDAIRMDAENLEAYLELGSVYQERREFQHALNIYRQAIRVAPEDHRAYYQSGLILRDSKDYSGAESMLRRAADLAPDNLAIRRLLVGVIALNLVHNKQEVSTL